MSTNVLEVNKSVLLASNLYAEMVATGSVMPSSDVLNIAQNTAASAAVTPDLHPIEWHRAALRRQNPFSTATRVAREMDQPLRSDAFRIMQETSAMMIALTAEGATE